MSSGSDLSILYNLRHQFTVIALTGRTGSGTSVVAEKIAKGFTTGGFPSPKGKGFDLNNNSYRKYSIAYKFAKENFGPYTLINYKEVLTLFLLKHPFSDFISFLNSDEVASYFQSEGFPTLSDFSNEIFELNKLEIEFNKIKTQFHVAWSDDYNENKKAELFCNVYFNTGFKKFSKKIHLIFRRSSLVKHSILFQLITNNLRRSGQPYISDSKEDEQIFTIALEINKIIKSVRETNKATGTPTKIVIDSLKNPFEVLFFRQRYAAFYLLAINRDDKLREKILQKYYGSQYEDMSVLIEQEYKGGKGKDFYKQYIRACIEKADIHLNYRSKIECDRLNGERIRLGDKTSPYFSWGMQLLKFIALIEKPGIITPSPEERCMQLAYTAKYNSGCISRQVGATITDQFYSVKAIGWNNTPQGQVPCSLRDTEALLNAFETLTPEDLANTTDPILNAFTPFERTDKKFKKALIDNYKEQVEANRSHLKGRTVCMCFKSLQNACYEGKNQVHTRSLHAEESAFLQITKYGGTAIKDGKLFTTASPCELCAKKAYQLGIKVIYYVDPYPGISQKQILDTGTNRPEVRLFNGVIGNAYHWLYEPLMAYKDELALILDQDIVDLTAKQKSLLDNQKAIIKAQKAEIAELREMLKQKETSKTNEQQ